MNASTTDASARLQVRAIFRHGDLRTLRISLAARVRCLNRRELSISAGFSRKIAAPRQ